MCVHAAARMPGSDPWPPVEGREDRSTRYPEEKVSSPVWRWPSASARSRSGRAEASSCGALFIDEGLGSLDPQSLDQAVEILRGLQDGHRMVGVIRHVEELKRRIRVQLLVKQEVLGSVIDLRSNA